MKPIVNEYTNAVLQPPACSLEGYASCESLPVCREGYFTFSYWQCTWAERLAILFGRPVRVCLFTTSQPPIALDTERH